ncbi:MAG: chemotaxis protein CheA, partial [Spirochaetales bacterium]|nr:chemotaxis protein CheA [Spirochaetales bacterium]
MNRDEQFSTVTSLLLKYETGDFLLLSDVSDALFGLKDYFLEEEAPCTLIEKLRKCVTEEMKQSGNESFVEVLSLGIDLLQRYTQARDEVTKNEMSAAMDAFSCGAEKEAQQKGAPEETRDEETFQIFLTEVRDRLDSAQETILLLEEHAEDQGAIQTLFRIFHTIKGECGFLKIATLGELTHNIENVLDDVRSGKSIVTPVHIDLLLEGLDMSRIILSRLERNDYVMFNDVPLESYVERLKSLSSQQCSNLGEILVASGKMREEDVQRVLQKQKETAFNKRFGEIAVQENYLSSEELRETLRQQKECKNSDSPKVVEHQDPVIKVRASKVNFLVDMIGELLIAMGQISGGGPELMQMRKITRSLQYGAMELRTDSLHSLFGNVRRAIRDLSKQLGKSVKTICTGEDLEIDRNLIEKLEEPLMHLVRNSLDHGMGTPDERRALEKEPQGTLTLKAERHGNSIVITVRDDGRGLDREKILAKAIDKGLVKPDAAMAMSDAQVYNLIFASGFSTNDSVSLISGRGVGMDIVKSVVTENRGRIEIDSEFGTFTEFRLIFPLSTAIIDGMIARVSDSLFVFPIGAVVETIKIREGMISSVSSRVDVACLRGESIPVIPMHDTFAIPHVQDEQVLIGI